ncbi:hypothetical protein BVC71_01335 [Marivivens niveibacter]|uniref:Flagellar assembly protein FliH/Type III secretion system HrpE domain-containing protein n=1 Tax=Marivivens niveibacter TaxID=1930667 RepID=A0A251X1C8_9RHOB|nr:hypothetical protein [Marivivens niveibacter]OUD10188.1 hypothetical protein BVC71_01335 [Marivivens niveibacter]
MTQPEPRKIRPADILEMIRSNAEQGFVERNFREPADATKFAAKTIADSATVIEDAENIAPVTEALVQGIPEAEVEHRIAAARAAAKAEGIAEERARLEGEINEERAQLQDAKAAFERAVARLSELHPEDSAQIVDTLDIAIRRLASERAGMEIDIMPLPFLTRIEAIADRVSQGIRSVKIRLNPGDFAAIEPYIGTSETIDPDMLSIDLGLGRGDVIVRSDAVRLEDVIAPNDLTAQPANEKAAAENSGRAPTANPAPKKSSGSDT